MNLQTIQKRIEELQAELLTVSNDLAHLLTGEISREPFTLPQGLKTFIEVKKGDTLNFSAPFADIDGDYHTSGHHDVTDVEVSDYDGSWSVEVDGTWINFNVIAKGQLITKVEA